MVSYLENQKNYDYIQIPNIISSKFLKLDDFEQVLAYNAVVFLLK